MPITRLTFIERVAPFLRCFPSAQVALVGEFALGLSIRCAPCLNTVYMLRCMCLGVRLAVRACLRRDALAARETELR